MDEFKHRNYLLILRVKLDFFSSIAHIGCKL